MSELEQKIETAFKPIVSDDEIDKQVDKINKETNLMKNKKLLIGASLITMLTTGAIGGVTPIQNASAHDISANQITTQYTVTDATQVN